MDSRSTAGNINIGGSSNDPSYRYKMPRIQAVVEGRGNGIRTVIVNMNDIARSLKRPPDYPTKWFGCELGAMSKYDPKTGRATVNGNHSQQQLAQLLEGFIQKYVLCPQCGLPETDMYVKKDAIKQDCKACGYNGLMDMSHRLTKSILHNPPAAEPAKLKKEKKVADTKLEKSVTKEKKTNKSIPLKPDENGDEISEDLAKEIENMEPFKDNGEEEEESASDKFKAFTSEKERTDKEIIDELIRLQKLEGFSSKSLIEILFEAIFEKNIRTKLKARFALLKQFVIDAETQTEFLVCIEKLCLDEQSVIKIVPVVLKELYEMDILEEDNIISWYDTVSLVEVDQKVASDVRRSAEPFITWLKTAEAESDEEEDNKEEN